MHSPQQAKSFARSALLCSLGLVFLALATRAKADPLYDGGAPGQLTGFDLTQWVEADDFTLTTASVVTSVKFWDVQTGSDFQNTIVWQIYSNSAQNTPKTLIASGTSMNLTHVATGADAFGYAEYVNTFDIPRVFLQAGTYWLALHNGDLSNIADQRVYWEGTRSIGMAASHNTAPPFNGSWITNVFAPSIATFGFDHGLAQISFNTISDQNYSVAYKNSMTDITWTPLPGAATIVGTGFLFQVTDPDSGSASNSHRFYLVRTAADLAFQLNGFVGPAITSLVYNNGTPVISFTTAAGQSYRVEYQNALNGGSWTPVSGAAMISGTGGVIQINDPDPNAKSLGHRFYRVVVL